MKSDRNRQLALDYLMGKSVAELAEREKLSVQRVNQILDKLAYRYMGRHFIRSVNPEQMLRALLDEARRDIRFVGPGEAQTPEEFHVEMENEPRLRSF